MTSSKSRTDTSVISSSEAQLQLLRSHQAVRRPFGTTEPGTTQPSNLDRALFNIENAVRSLPKADLHSHLTGCLRPSTVVELLGRDPASEHSLYFQKQAGGLFAFLKPWRFALSLIDETPYTMIRVLSEIAEDYAADGVLYAELRVSARGPALRGNLPAYLQALSIGVRQALADTGVTLRILLGFARQHISGLSTENVRTLFTQIVRDTEEFKHDLVVGFDMWGIENREGVSDALSLLDEARSSGHRLALHVGEEGNPLALKHALKSDMLDRISHGPSVFGHPSVLKLVVEHDITTEVCLTSNWLTRRRELLSNHPSRTLLDLGGSVVFCTDNVVVCNTTLSSEYARALAFGIIQPRELLGLLLSSFSRSFADPGTKQTFSETVAERWKANWVKTIEDLVADFNSEYYRAWRTKGIGESWKSKAS